MATKNLGPYKTETFIGGIDAHDVFTGEGAIKCPNCGEHFTHLESIIPYSTDTNRPCVELIFSCEYCSHDDGKENGARFSICIQQHEGITYLTNKPEY